MIDINILVGGEAGQGIQTIGFVLGKTLVRGGLHVFADQDYESRIRGGHNFFRIRVSDLPLTAQTEKLDIIISLDQRTVELHRQDLKAGGAIILDRSAIKIEDSPALLDVPLEKLAEAASGEKIMSNSVAIGAALGLMGFDFDILSDTLRWHFAKLNAQVRENNVKAAQAGYDYARQHLPPDFKSLIHSTGKGERLFLNANEALALGSLAAGCNFLAAYPMTPITSIIEYMADKGRQYGVAVIQPEDEISAINMVIGASYAGARAMTVTSGSGFALMVEGIGLAGITETPAVIVLGQRPGPAVGLPTRSEQGELLFALNAGTGEFPRVILAPSSAEEAFYLLPKAFNLAEKYQIPVIVLTDTHLANSYTDVEKFDLSKVKIERGKLIDNSSSLRDYQRYELTDSGISLRAIPGQGEALVCADADEHNASGHLIEDIPTRVQQMDKRLRKLETLQEEIADPLFETQPEANLTLIGWGSTLGAIREAVALLKNQSINVNILHFSEIWPFPQEFVTNALQQTPGHVVIENNSTGQMATLIRQQTGIEISGRINKYDGRPLSAQYIVDELLKGVL